MATTAGSTRINIDLALNTRGFRPLGRINGQLGEFEKSLDASNARVLAFGASAGAILAVRKAFTATVKSAIEVEKSLKDINVILQVTSKNLQRFGSDLFKIASETGQSFKVAAEAATELARQGLGVEETLKRTRDALILSRLAGLDAAEAVNALTAALNTFTKVGLDSTAIINKLANVDAAFAVSSEDLAKALGRVGSAAVSAGVNLDQLLAIVTTAQQKTARGGAVIGNSFKTIFTRIQRPRVIKELENLGVQVRGLEGDTLPAIKVLENLAKQFDNLSQSQRAQISELVGGVFQVNVLKAALSDLNREQGIYNRALGISIGSSDQAIRRNEELNETLAAQFQRTINTFKEAAAEIGGLTFGPALENIFGTINKTFDAASGDGSLAKAGQAIARSVFDGIGKFIGGPGLVIIGALLVKTFLQLATFAADAFKTLAGLNKNLQNQLNLQKQIFGVLSENPDLMNRIRAGTLSVEDAHTLVLQRINEETTALDRQLQVSQRIAQALSGSGVVFSSDFGATSGGERKFGRGGGRGRSGGYIPNFANEEVLGMMMGGYSSSQLANPKVRRDTIHNGRGGAFSATTNGHESIVDFTNSKGKKATAVIPPKGSQAFKDFMGALSGGYMPNFAKMSRADVIKSIKDGKNPQGWNNRTDLPDSVIAQAQKNSAANKAKKTTKQKPVYPIVDLKQRYGGLALFGTTGTQGTVTANTKDITRLKGKQGVPSNITFTNFQSKSFLGEVEKKDKQNEFSALIKKHMAKPMENITNDFAQSMGLNDDAPKVTAAKIGRRGNTLFPPGAEGSIFETAINAMTKNAKSFEAGLAGDTSALWDFEESGNVDERFKKKFGYTGKLVKADAKRTLSKDAINSIGNKIFSTLLKPDGSPKMGQDKIAQQLSTFAKGPNAAGGFIPSFSALHQAIARERSAGVPANRIRVGSSRSLASGLNPMGLGVYNTQDEPGGLGQGIRRSLASGTNPRTAGMVPNFAPQDNLGKNTAALLGVSIGLSFVQQAISELSEGIEEGENANMQVVSAIDGLQSGLLKFGSILALGSFLPKGLTANRNLGPVARGVGSTLGTGLDALFVTGGAPRESGPASTTRTVGSGSRAAVLRRTVLKEPGFLSRGETELRRSARGRSRARTVSTPSKLRSGIGRAGGAIGGPVGVAAAGFMAFDFADTLRNETFNDSFKELQEATKNFERISEETEKNIGKLTKFGEAAEQAEKVFNDSNASMSQVLQAQKVMRDAMVNLPQEIQSQVSGLVDPTQIQAVVQEGLEQQQRNKQQAQARKDVAETVREIRKTDFGLVDPLKDLRLTDQEAQERRDRDLRQVRGTASTAFSGLAPDQIANFRGSADLVRDLRLGATDLSARRNAQAGLRDLGLDQTTIDAFVKGMEEGEYSANLISEALAEEFILRQQNISVEKALAPEREKLLRATRAQQRAIDDAKKALELEQKIRRETIKISSKASKAFLSSVGSIKLDQFNKQAEFQSKNAIKFGNSLAATSKALGSANVSGGLGQSIRQTLAIGGARGAGSIDRAVIESQTAALRAQAENATAAERASLEALATQLENLNSTSDRIFKENQAQLYETTRIANAQIAAARQQERIKSFGGPGAILDPSKLNPIFAQLQGAQQAGAIAARAGNRLGVDRARVNQFSAIQDLLGGSLDRLPPNVLANARGSAERVAFNQISTINRGLGLGLSQQDIQKTASEQAASLFKGDSLTQNNRNLESLNATLQLNNQLLSGARNGASYINQMQMNAAQAQQAGYADFRSRQEGLSANARRRGGDLRGISSLYGDNTYGASLYGGPGGINLIDQQTRDRQAATLADRVANYSPTSSTSQTNNFYINGNRVAANPQLQGNVDKMLEAVDRTQFNRNRRKPKVSTVSGYRIIE